MVGIQCGIRRQDTCVLKLKKALHGSKQASPMLQLKLRSLLVESMEFIISSDDPCLFSRTDSDGSVIIVDVYVDDIIVAHDSINLSRFIDK